MRARCPDDTGRVTHEGITVGWEVDGDGAPTLLLLPTWTIVHSRFWRAQVDYLTRHFPGRHLRRPGQRSIRSSARPVRLRGRIRAARRRDDRQPDHRRRGRSSLWDLDELRGLHLAMSEAMKRECDLLADLDPMVRQERIAA